MNDIALQLDTTEITNPQEFWRLLTLLRRDSTNTSELPSIEDFLKLFKINAQHKRVYHMRSGKLL